MSINTLQDLETRLQKHDWTFSFSDDYSVYYRGHRDHNEIRDAAVCLGDDGKRLYNKYHAKAWKDSDSDTWRHNKNVPYEPPFKDV